MNDHKISLMGSKSFCNGEEEHCQNNPCREDVLLLVFVSRAEISEEFVGRTGAWWLEVVIVRKEKGEILDTSDTSDTSKRRR